MLLRQGDGEKRQERKYRKNKKAFVISVLQFQVLPYPLLSPIFLRAAIARVLVYTKLSVSHLVIDSQ